MGFDSLEEKNIIISLFLNNNFNLTMLQYKKQCMTILQHKSNISINIIIRT